ncbi:MAG TPA: hypothetical protein VHG08_08850 [Longimicrobium sp.]|nr:hypothetical protein [Longimicrobium sp.]
MNARQNRRRRLHRSLTIHLWMRRAPAVLVVSALIVGFGWVSTKYRPAGVERCLLAYGRARTAGDSASADQVVVGALRRNTCGGLRRDGTLDRHRQASAQGDTPASGARRPGVAN